MYTINCTPKALIACDGCLFFCPFMQPIRFLMCGSANRGYFSGKWCRKGLFFLHSHSNTNHQPFPNNHCPINHPPKFHNSSTLYAFHISYISSLLNTFSVPDFSNKGHFYKISNYSYFIYRQYTYFIVIYCELITNVSTLNRGYNSICYSDLYIFQTGVNHDVYYI